MAIAPGRALTTAFVAPGADQTLDIGLHQQLEHRLRHSSQEITVTSLLQQLRQRQSLLGHRILSRPEVEVSQLPLSRQVRWPPPTTPPQPARCRAESPPLPG